MQKHIKSFILLAVFISVLSSGTANAEPIGGYVPAELNYGGALMNHDMMMIKEKQRQRDEAEDFQNFQERKKNKNKKESVINDNSDSTEKYTMKNHLKN